MIEVSISEKYKAELSSLRGVSKDIQAEWNKVFPGVDSKSAILLENQRRFLNEVNSTTDLGGDLDGGTQSQFPMMPIVRRIIPTGISRKLVSIQPILYPTAMVFYYDPKIETAKGSSAYISLIEARSGHSNYDISLGEATSVNGAMTAITAAQYLSGASFTVPYSGGVGSLSSLQVFLEYDQTGLSGRNGIVTSSPTSLFTGMTFDDNVDAGTNYLIVSTANQTGWCQFQFTSLTPNITSYTLKSSLALPPTLIELCGSTDSTSWSQLDYHSGLSLVANTTYRYNLATESTGNTYFRFNFSGAIGTLVTELELLGYEALPYAVSPQTWGQNLFANNRLSLIATTDETWLSGSNRTAYTRYNTYASNEAVSGMQQVQLNITGTSISCNTRKLKASWTEELDQNLKSFFGISMVDEVANLMATEIALEIDRQVISDLINIAPYQTSWHYSPRSAVTRIDGTVIPVEASSARVTQEEWNQTLLIEANKISAMIGRANFNHEANWIVCSAKVGSVLRDNIDFVPTSKDYNPHDDYMISYAGRVNCKYDLYIDPMLPDDICLIGYLGDNDYDCGYIYAPYIALQPTPKVVDPSTLYDWKFGIMNRAAKKVVNNKKYGLIRVTFPSDYEVING